MKNSVDNFVAGKISKGVKHWSKLTSDRWIHQIIQGNILELKETPERFPKPHTIGFPKKDKAALDIAVDKFVQQEVIEPCSDNDGPAYYSSIFPRPKRDGSVRVIINLKGLNTYVDNYHFKMDTVRDVLHLVQPKSFFASIDFKDAYYSVPLANDIRKYFRFKWDKQLYQFTCMPQGLASAPRIFTKLLKPALAHLRSRGHTIMCYIDDCLLVSTDREHLQEGIQEALTLFDNLGLTINLEKSILTPVQAIEYLGVIIDSREMTVTLTPRKQEKIEELCQQLSKKSNMTIQELSALIGNLVAADVTVTNGPLHYKDLEIARNDALTKHYGNYDAVIPITDTIRAQVTWWLENISQQFRNIIIPDPQLHLYSDASLTGWGGKLDSVETGGHWHYYEDNHINVLELKAALLTLKSLCRSVENTHIRLHMDNTTAVACVNKCGSTKLPLLGVTKELFGWAEEKAITLSACHIPGVLNVEADRASRTLNTDTEWMLKPAIFQKLTNTFGSPNIDLFASVLNTQLPVFASWRPDPSATYIDSFMMSWSNQFTYAFPPFSMIAKTLQKIQSDNAKTLLIAPLWPTRTWFPVALQLLIAPPVLLPRRCLQLPQDLTAQHPLAHKLKLVAMLLSGSDLQRKTYRRMLPRFYSKAGAPQQNHNIGVISSGGCLFVSNGQLIRFAPL